MRRIDVGLRDAAYGILIEPGLLERLGDIVIEVAPHDTGLLVTDSGLTATYGRRAAETLETAGLEVTRFELVADETHKILQTVASLYDTMLAARLERGSPVVAMGGGVVGDVAGFAAATYQRGVPLVQVPTTLLAMVDAAVGGKTGVNWSLPDGTLGKNLIGSFWQPRAVVVDPSFLHTLDPRDFRCGLAECVKAGIIASAELLEFLERHVDSIMARDEETMVELIDRAARIKVAIVEQDEREAGQRALLNLGHSFGHAIETITELDLRHGEAVAIGLVAACACAVAIGTLASGEAARVRMLIESLGLPTRLPRPVDVEVLLERMRYDKKVQRGAMRIVVPTSLGSAEVVRDPAPAAVSAGWEAVAPGGTP